MSHTVSMIAVVLGANVIEKHFCLSPKIKNLDSSSSIEPAEFKQIGLKIRETEKSLEEISFKLNEQEKRSKQFKRSIFAVRDINEGKICLLYILGFKNHKRKIPSRHFH